MSPTLRATAALLGVLLGLGLFTFFYARGWSYLTNDPAACKNCHIMNEQYDGWVHGSHRTAAVCNDCHMPASFAGKWFTKAYNGFWHSFYFTLGGFHEPIEITARDRRITETRCRSCHESVVQLIDANHKPGHQLACTGCHSSVGHK